MNVHVAKGVFFTFRVPGKRNYWNGWPMFKEKGSQRVVSVINHTCFHVKVFIPIDATPCKRGRPKKAKSLLSDRYPALTVDDNSAEDDKSVYDAFTEEMRSEKPRSMVFLPLMKSTFVMRRHFILHDATSVHHILQEYPALKTAEAVS